MSQANHEEENVLTEAELASLKAFVDKEEPKIQATPTHVERLKYWGRATRTLIEGVLGGQMSIEEAQRIAQTVFVSKEIREETDPMTGLYNRRGLLDRLEREAEANRRNPDQPFSIAYMDFDHFGDFNNRFGHDMGDEVLIAGTHFIRDALRATDTLGRAGGEEIIAILANADEERAFKVMDRIREGLPLALSALTTPLGENVKVTMSVGVAQYILGENLTIEADDGLIKRADTRVRMAKEAGRNMVIGNIVPQL